MKRASFKGQLERHHLIPLTYWFERYAGRRVTLFIFRFLALELLSLLAALLVMRLWIIDSLGYFFAYWLLAWVGFTSFYELGYFMNDFWSERRERNRVGVLWEEPPVSKSILWPAVLTRITVASLALVSIGLLGSATLALQYGGMLLVTAATFAVHNLIYFPMRVATFTLLYVLRYSICGLFIVQEGAVAELIGYGGLVIPVALAYGAKYGLMRMSEGTLLRVKGFWKSLITNLIKNDASIIPRVAIALIILEVIVLAVAGLTIDTLSFGAVTGLLVILRWRRPLATTLGGALGRKRS